MEGTELLPFIDPGVCRGLVGLDRLRPEDPINEGGEKTGDAA